MNLLIIDDQKQLLKNYKERFEMDDCVVQTAQTSHETFEILKEFNPNVILLDVYLGDEYGLDLLKELQAKMENCPPIIIMTADPEAEITLKARKYGAVDFITKTTPLSEIVETVFRFKKKESSEPIEPYIELPRLVGKSKELIDLSKEISKAAEYHLNTLILGETGTGKDRVARTIHEYSSRQSYPFVIVDCPSIPKDLFESELFGYKKGAHSEANTDRKGLALTAQNGILFFNEIGELPWTIQGKLLGFIENKRIKPLGSDEYQKLDIQILAATNRNLEEMVETDMFREDLLYRLKSNCIIVPPLREHKEDISLLVEHFLKIYSRENKKNIEKIDPEVIRFLGQQNWPGNIRELERVYIKPAIINCQNDTLKLSDFNMQELSHNNTIRKKSDSDYFNLSYQRAKETCMTDFHKNYISHYLKNHNYRQSAAAEAMGESRQSLNNLIKKYGIQLQKD